MKKHNEKHSKKIRNLVVICLLCGIVLAASTYAWFIGMRTVNVSSFDINVASTEGLYLSMDGKSWTYNLDVANAPKYANNANKLADVELIPMSTVGDMDVTSSRMKLYEKGSLTATKGGYRLLASQVNNHKARVGGDTGEYIEGDGYIAFDLFIKNLSGEEYYVEKNPLNEEAIYLTTNSSVTVAEGGVENTGIENSIRVGFAQLGRVSADVTDEAVITGITCTSTTPGIVEIEEDPDFVTGICREAQIWEPNDTAHVQNAINWYNEACEERIIAGTDVNADASYTDRGEADTTTCKPIADATPYSTYAISREIIVDDNVNIYDGEDYNKYTANTIDYATYLEAEEEAREGYKLVDFPYFTDSMKILPGTARPTFMTLAPNSITKVRVYVWLEGQDVDNYDFAQLGRQITVNFGFTKERFTENDVDHEGPSTDITEGYTFYEATGDVTVTTPDTGITYDADRKYFIIPADYNEDFEFTDDATTYRAVYSLENEVDTWTIASYTAHTAAGAVVITTPNTGITYDTENNRFIIPITYQQNFEFTDNDVAMVATYQTGTFSIAKKN